MPLNLRRGRFKGMYILQKQRIIIRAPDIKQPPQRIPFRPLGLIIIRVVLPLHHQRFRPLLRQQSLRGTQKHWQKIGEIPSSMYHREVQMPSKGQPDIAEDLLWRLLKRYPYLRTTEGRIDKPKRHI